MAAVGWACLFPAKHVFLTVLGQLGVFYELVVIGRGWTKVHGQGFTSEHDMHRPALIMWHALRAGKTLRFCYDRLSSLLKTLEITDMDDFTPLHMARRAPVSCRWGLSACKASLSILELWE